MHEDELTISGSEEGVESQEDTMLPSGWADGDDIFADPSTWSGASHFIRIDRMLLLSFYHFLHKRLSKFVFFSQPPPSARNRWPEL